MQPGIDVDADRYTLFANNVEVAVIERLPIENADGTTDAAFIGPRMRKAVPTLEAAAKTVLRNEALAAVTAWDKAINPKTPTTKIERLEAKLAETMAEIEAMLAQQTVDVAEIDEVEKEAQRANLSIVRSDPKPDKKHARK